MSDERLVFLSSPDDFLLELARMDEVAAWVAAHPGGEVVTLDPAPPAARLVQEIASPSLFVSERLIVVPDATAYLPRPRRSRGKSAGDDDGEDQGGHPRRGASSKPEGSELAAALGELRLQDVSVLFAAVLAAEPKKDPLVDVFARRGGWTWLPCPEEPKPWEQGRVSAAERAVLTALVRRVAPAAAAEPEVVDALIEAHGFHPRALAQAAERLVIGGNLSRAAVREQAGPGECTVKDIEDILIARDVRRAGRYFATLSAGGSLRNWRDEAVDPTAWGPLLGGLLGGLLRRALAVRGHARAAGLERELSVRACAARDWYQRGFKSGILPRLQAEIDACPDSPVARMTPWQLHRAFRLAAALGERTTIDVLARLDRSGLQRAHTRDMAIIGTSEAVLALLSARAA